jgi:hypothetical protein
MVLSGELSIGFLDLLRSSRPRYTKHLVVISKFHVTDRYLLLTVDKGWARSPSPSLIYLSTIGSDSKDLYPTTVELHPPNQLK